MNLHKIVDNRPLWFWCRIFGNRHTCLGVHLYLLPRGNPPPVHADPITFNSDRWRWRPFLDATTEPIPAALCGYKTRSKNPYRQIEEARWYRHCTNCVVAAANRGILPTLWSTINEVDTEIIAIREEYARWSNR